MKTEDSRNKKTPFHVKLEENTPLYLHIVKHANTLSSATLMKRSTETPAILPFKAHWIPPPGKTTLKIKHHKWKAQSLRTQNGVSDMAFIGGKVEQLENLVSSLQEIVNKNIKAISKEKVETKTDCALVQKLTEKSEKNFVKLYQEQQYLINKCLQVIDASKRVLTQPQAVNISQIRDAYAQTQLSLDDVDTVRITKDNKTAEIKERNDEKLKSEIENLKKALRLSKQEIENCKEINKRWQDELKEKVELLKKLAVERDRWKIRLTKLTNEKLETETQVTYMKSEIQNLQKEVFSLADLAANKQDSMIILTELHEENEKLRAAKMILENQVLDAHNEISHLKTQRDKWHDEMKMNLNKTTTTTDMPKLVSIVVKDAGSQTSAMHLHSDKEAAHNNSNSHLKEEAKETQNVVQKFESDLGERKGAIDQLNVKLASKELEVGFLNEKLEAMRNEVQTEHSKWSSKVSCLETSLWNKKSEISELKREKQQMEDDYLSKLEELEKKLESTMTTNRSLQKYIALLRSSYATVFGDPTLSEFFTLPE